MRDTHIGPYQIVRATAQSGIGETFEAVDGSRNKKVNLIELRSETVTADILSRLYSEAKTLAVLNHPNIARMFGFIRRDEHIYLVTEFVDGQTLESYLRKQGRLQLTSALGFMHQVISGVAFAHGLGVIHGDLQPSNILVTKHGPVKILNFAIAHLVGRSDALGCRRGNLRFTSPEQMDGETPDARSDIYSMGRIFYELIVGKSPFDVYGFGEEGVGDAQGRLIPAPPSLIVPGLPKWLDDFLLRMLAAYPSDRFQTVKEAARALEDGIARTAASTVSPGRLQGRQGWAVFPPFHERFVSVEGGRFLEAMSKTVSAVARFPVRQGRVVADAAHARATGAFSTLKRVVHGVSAEFDSRLNPKPRLVRFRNSLAGHLKADWRRYAQAACLLLVISVEGFYFRGANILFLMEGRLRAGPSLNEAVDSMFAQIDREVWRNEGRAIEKGEAGVSSGGPLNARPKKSPVAVVESENPSRRSRPAEKSAASAPIRVRSEPAPKLADNRPAASSLSAANSKRETTVPALRISSVKEPDMAAPVGTPRSNSSTSELKIKWEN